MRNIKFNILQIRDYYLGYKFLQFKYCKVTYRTGEMFKKDVLYFLDFLHKHKVNIGDVNINIMNQYEEHLKTTYKHAKYKLKNSIARSFYNYLFWHNLVRRQWFESDKRGDVKNGK